jgi:hypothetical protein
MRGSLGTLREQVYALAFKKGLRVQWCDKIGEAGVHDGKGIIQIHRIVGPLSYYVAMHELGHVYTEQPGLFDRTPMGELFRWEIEATQWAVEHGLIPVPERVKSFFAWALSTYWCPQTDVSFEHFSRLKKQKGEVVLDGAPAREYFSSILFDNQGGN